MMNPRGPRPPFSLGVTRVLVGAIAAATLLLLAACGSGGDTATDQVDSLSESATAAPVEATPTVEPAATAPPAAEPAEEVDSSIPANLGEFQDCVTEGGLAIDFVFDEDENVTAINLTGEVDAEVMGQMETACGQFLADYDGELNLPPSSDGADGGSAAQGSGDGTPPDNLVEFRECVAEGGLDVGFTYGADGEVVVIDITGEASEELFEQLDPCGEFLGDYRGDLNLPETSLEDRIDETVLPAPASTCEDEMVDYEVCTLVPSVGFGLDGVAVSTDGDLLASNFGKQQAGTVIYRVTTGGEVSIFADEEERPLNLVQGPDGSVIVGRRTSDLVMLSADGTETVIHSVEADRNVDPLGTDASGALYFAVQSPTFSGGTRLEQLSPDGQLSILFEDDSLPWGPAGVDPDSNVYMANDDVVSRIDAEGRLTELVKIPGAMGDGSDLNQGGFGGMAVTEDRIYVASFFARGVYAIDFDGNYELIAGGNLDPATDGVGQGASFTSPNRLAVDPDSNWLYVSDYEASSIRVIQLPAVAAAIAPNASTTEDAAATEGTPPANLVEFQDCVAESGLEVEFTYGEDGEVVFMAVTGDIEPEALNELEPLCGPLIGDYQGDMSLPGDGGTADGSDGALEAFIVCMEGEGIEGIRQYATSETGPPGEVTDTPEFGAAMDVCEEFLDSNDGEKTHTEVGLAEYAVSTLHSGVADSADGFVLADDGFLYVAEYGLSGQHVYQVAPSGEITVVTDQLRRPVGMAIDESGTLVVGTGGDDGRQIVSVGPDGSTTPLFIGDNSGGIALGNDGALHFLKRYEDGEFGLAQIRPDGEVVEIVKDAQIPDGQAIAVDGAGITFVAATYGPSIVSISPAGEVEVITEIPTAVQGGVSFTDAVVIDGSLYLAGYGMEVIYKVEMDGSYAVIAGNSEAASAIDGPGDEASFLRPVRMVHDETNNTLLVIEYDTGDIRVVTLD